MIGKQHLGPGGIAFAFLAVAALGGCGRPEPDPRGLRPNETLLSVSATARVETVPDQARFTAGLSSIAPDARAASARNADVMNRITASLARLKIPAGDIQTRDLGLGRIGYGPNRGRYEASNTIAVRVRDVKRAGEAIAAVTAAGANIVSGPDLSVSDPEKASLGAYGNAYRTARAKADAYAAAAGLTVVRTLMIRDDAQTAPIESMMDMASRESFERPRTVAPPVMAGTNTGVVSANVEFVLAPRE